MSVEDREGICKILNRTNFRVLAWYFGPKETEACGLKYFKLLKQMAMQSTGGEKFTVYVYYKTKQVPDDYESSSEDEDEEEEEEEEMSNDKSKSSNSNEKNTKGQNGGDKTENKPQAKKRKKKGGKKGGKAEAKKQKK